MKILYLILILVLSYSQILAQSERPETIVIPVATMGDVTETRKQILLNSLEENLKIYFKIISQDRFEQAQEKAFEELEYEECTEEQCIVLIQEMLQVENSFSLQVIAEGTNSQLSLTWITLDEKKKATDVCRDCDSFELNDRIKILVDKLISDKEIRQVSQLSNNEKENNSSLEEDRERKEKRDILVRERKKRLLEEGRKEPIRQSNLSDIQKEKYFDDFFSSRTRMLQFGYSESGLYFFNDKIIDNTTSPVRRLIHKGFNIGFKYYFQEKISFSVSYSSRTLDDVIHKMPHVQVSSMSGTSSDINLISSYHWIFFDNLELLVGAGFSNVTSNAKFKVSSKIHEVDVSMFLLSAHIGFYYHLQNNFAIIFEGNDFQYRNTEVSISNNRNNHKRAAWSNFHFGLGYFY